MPSKRLWCKWACPFVPQGLSFAPRFDGGAKLWTQLRASKAVFSSIRQIDEKTGLRSQDDRIHQFKVLLCIDADRIVNGLNHFNLVTIFKCSQLLQFFTPLKR